jgi:hypothetical protein
MKNSNHKKLPLNHTKKCFLWSASRRIFGWADLTLSGAPQLGQNTALAGALFPHFGQYTSLILSHRILKPKYHIYALCASKKGISHNV